MAAPTNAALVKKALANSEPSTHGPQLIFQSGQRNVCFERNSGKYLLVVSFSAHEPGCVKTRCWI
jgi:hypothetical protein